MSQNIREKALEDKEKPGLYPTHGLSQFASHSSAHTPIVITIANHTPRFSQESATPSPKPVSNSAARLTISGSRQPKLDAAIARLRSTFPSSMHPTHLSDLACDLSDLDALEANLTALLDFTTANGTIKLNHIINTAGDSFSLPPLSQITPDALHQSSTVRFYGSIMLAKLLAATPGRPRKA